MSNPGFALLLSDEFRIQEIIHTSNRDNNLKTIKINFEEKRLLSSYISADSRSKFFDFLEKLSKSKAEYKWEINFINNDNIINIFLSGIYITDNDILILGLFAPDDIVDQFEYFMKINNQYINQIRSLLKKQLRDKDFYWENTGSETYQEMSQINNEIITMQRQLIKANQKLKAKEGNIAQLNQKLDEEIDKAVKIHERSLPEILPDIEGISIASYYRPSKKMGGDLYDIIRKENKLIIYISDVTGHGLDAAMLSSFIRHTIRTYIKLSNISAIHPDQLIRFLLGQYLEENYPEEYFICIYMFVLDLNSLELEYLGLGMHIPPIIYKGKGDAFKLKNNGLPISRLIPREKICSDLETKKVILEKDDLLFITSDGLIEQEKDGKYYGYQGEKIISKSTALAAEKIAKKIIDDFYLFNNNSTNGSDDITFLLLKIKGGF